MNDGMTATLMKYKLSLTKTGWRARTGVGTAVKCGCIECGLTMNGREDYVHKSPLYSNV